METFYPKTKKQWRKWLEKNHLNTDGIWLIMYKKASEKPSISWSDAVDEALCFGWIDSIKKSLDHEQSVQFFSKRKPRSTWSKINKAKVQRLVDAGLMTAAGYASIETAKQNGYWTILDEVEALKIPDDLEKAFEDHQGARAYFLGLSKSQRKMQLQWLVLARRPETREKRINEIAIHAAQGLKPKQFR